MNNEQQILQMLEQLANNQASNSKQILTVDEAASFLNLEKAYLYKLTHSGSIPFSKPNGKKIYFSKEDLVRWALSNRSSSRQELEEKAATYNSLKSGK